MNAIVPQESTCGVAPTRTLDSLLACPRCRGPLFSRAAPRAELACGRCSAAFPSAGEPPHTLHWMYADNDAARAQWSAHRRGFMQHIDLEIAQLRESADGPRAQQMLRGKLRLKDEVAQLLASVPAEARAQAHGMVPRGQGLLGYVNNAFRDWSWRACEGESKSESLEWQAHFERVRVVLEHGKFSQPKSLAVLGGGANRFGFELEHELLPEFAVYLDCNPLLSELSRRVFAGDSVALHEFPLAPRNGRTVCVGQQLQAERGAAAVARRFLIGDVMKAPLAPSACDMVFTPWLIDIMPDPLDALLPQINRLLKTDGVWLNTGSLAFHAQSLAYRYAPDEVIDKLTDYGFELVAHDVQALPYLCSPHSGHGRREEVVTFAARKVRDCETESSTKHPPEREVTDPVPSGPAVTTRASEYLLHAQVLGAINGERSAGDIAQALAAQYDIAPSEALRTVQRILEQTFRESEL